MAERKRNADGTFRKESKKSGLGAVATTSRARSYAKAQAPKYLDGAKKGGAIVAGLLAASVARGVLNKIVPASTGTGINTNQLIADVAITAGGVFLASNSSNELLKYAGYGVAANGVAGVVKSVTGKDMLSPALSGVDLNEFVAGLGFGDAGQEVNGIGAANVPMIDLSTIPVAPAINGVGASDEVSGVGAANALYQDMGAVDPMVA